jgi:phosphate transport system permease protein
MTNKKSTLLYSNSLAIVMSNLPRRKRAEVRFRLYGLASIFAGLGFLCVLFSSIIYNGYSAFQYTYIALDVYYDASLIAPSAFNKESEVMDADYAPLWRTALASIFPDVSDRQKRRALYAMISSSAGDILREVAMNNFAVIGTTNRIWVPADDAVDVLYKNFEHLDKERLTDRQKEHASWLERMKHEGRVEKRLNTIFFANGDSREPELAGIWGAVSGSLLTLLVTLGLSFPVGIAAAIYLEEFAPRNKWTDIVEVNINNLAAVPSIVYGLLGLAIFINTFHLPRSSPLVGGLVLTLMTLPVMIIAGRSALKSVPPSIREAALGIGASPLQAVLDHVLPLAMPGMLTGSIIGAARALGESAPLLMIGMVAFIVDIPKSINDPATVLPVQIYLWADSPEHAFTERTSAAILVLLAFLITMNGCAVYLRKHYERRW